MSDNGVIMRRLALRSLAVIVGCGVLFAAYIGIQLYYGNMHEVVAGEFYRAGQPDGHDIARYQRNYGIKTIINLRGGNPEDAWYQEEVATAKKLGITHIDFRMKAARELTQEQAIALIATMRDAPKPLLVHCRSGSDRTGLAAALYLAAIRKESEMTSERQLWMSYGHLPFRINASYAMTRTFEMMEPHFGFPDS